MELQACPDIDMFSNCFRRQNTGENCLDHSATRTRIAVRHTFQRIGGILRFGDRAGVLEQPVEDSPEC